ncbi:MAG: RNA polymerase subunit sigma-70 [Actinomycetales bacterium]|nr:RNA polymerase subunit sigma-70 [Actinomycetales bacterium]
MDRTPEFERERPRLTRIAGSILGDRTEAEDVVQQAWLRLERADSAAIDSLPGWLTTVVTRLCLDRLKAAVPVPAEPVLAEPEESHAGFAADFAPDPAADLALADSVGAAMRVVLHRLGPTERVAFVLHDSFAIDFATIAGILDCTPAAARKLASRARARLAGPDAGPAGQTVDWVVVDAFLRASREGEFARLLELLAPDVVVVGDPVAVGIGTPERIEGRDAVAGFFNGAAAAALPVFVHARPGAAWYDRGTPRVVFDFRVDGGVVTRIDFRAEPGTLETVVRRRDGVPR